MSVQDLAAQRALMTKCLARAIDAKLYGSWDKWAGLAAEFRRLRSVIQRAVHSGLSKGWNSWLNTLDEYERMRAVLRTAQNAAVGAQHAATEAAPIASARLVRWNLRTHARVPASLPLRRLCRCRSPRVQLVA